MQGYSKKKKCYRHVKKPEVVCEYGKFMKGVDLNNQYCSYYAFTFKGHKWYKPVFIRLIEASVVNSYLIYKKLTKNKTTHLNYRFELIEALVNKYDWFSNQKQQRKKVKHTISKLKSVRDCAYCSRRKSGRRKRTVFYCRDCEEETGKIIALCFGSCFYNYHCYYL